MNFKFSFSPDPIPDITNAIIVSDAGYSQPPPSTEKSHPLFIWVKVAPTNIGIEQRAARRVCIPSIKAIPPMTSPKMTR